MLAADPGLAGVDRRGIKSTEFASVTASTSGAIASRITSMAAYMSNRYRPTSLGLTELFFDEATFGADDLESYRTQSRQPGWRPRSSDGNITVDHPSVASWRSSAVSGFVTRLRELVRRSGVPLDMDVRVSWDRPAVGRPESGHDYELLLAAADRLLLWSYFALSGRTAAESYFLAAALAASPENASSCQSGCGPRATSASAPTELAQALTRPADGGARAVAVTPTSLMTADHWAAVREAWKD